MSPRCICLSLILLLHTRTQGHITGPPSLLFELC